MLTVYTYRVPRPPNCFDVSGLPLDELCDTVLDICAHQRDIVLWFGYLDGWMLTPREEVLLRKAIRQFSCVVVSHFPLAFSHAWKNEIDKVYTEGLHGDSQAHDDGRAVHHGGKD